MNRRGSVLKEDTRTSFSSQESFSIRALLETHFSVEFHGQGPRYMVLCPWHDDVGPSLSVDDERGVYHCFGCGVGGNALTLARNLGLAASKSYFQGHPVWSAGNNIERGVFPARPRQPATEPPGWFEATALEVLGEFSRAAKMQSCRTRWRVGKCGNCGSYPAYPFSCRDRLCPRCRAERLRNFLDKHLERLSEDQIANLVEVQVAQGGELDTDDLVSALELLRIGINGSLRALKASGWVYAFRLVREDGGWRVLARILVLGDEKDGYVASFAFIQAGLVVNKGAEFGIGARDALEKLVGWAAKPYVGLKTAADVEIVAAVLKGRRVIQGSGALYRVSGGATSGGGGKRKKPCCCFCGSENVQWMFNVAAADIVLENGPPHWDPVEERVASHA